MSVQVSFRVVGLYCYFENLVLPSVSPGSTVKEIMDAVKAAQPAFDYKSGPTSTGKEIVDTLSYTYGPGSTRPYNTAGVPADGFRSESNSLGGVSLVWQYYRSVTGTIDGAPYEIKIITPGQPSFATTPLNTNLSVPSSFQLATYNLTWRLLRIELTPETQSRFLAAKTKALGY